MGSTELRIRASAMADENGWNEYKRLVLKTLEDHSKRIEKLNTRIGKMEMRLAVGATVFAVVVWLISNWRVVASVVGSP